MDFPAHVYKFGAAGDQTLTVAWSKNKTPITNTIQEVGDQAAFDAAMADGWSDSPVLAAPAKRTS